VQNSFSCSAPMSQYVSTSVTVCVCMYFAAKYVQNSFLCMYCAAKYVQNSFFCSVPTSRYVSTRVLLFVARVMSGIYVRVICGYYQHTQRRKMRTRGERAIRLWTSGFPPHVEGHSSKNEGGNSSIDEWSSPTAEPLVKSPKRRGGPRVGEGHSSKDEGPTTRGWPLVFGLHRELEKGKLSTSRENRVMIQHTATHLGTLQHTP